ncbi:hypothetical protein GCM10022422_14510 [Flavobacterium ginsengisoli]|uniref:Uncharacterized protein n=1 Tax=Flavobacterium ginsengisoli TaxID=871694 RepID=A0ABP7F7F6_9FLAO|nr:hypothetical protein [Flavobacterium ginsengisoli]
MNLFHVSSREYTVGQIIKAEDFENTEYYQNAITQNKNWIDDYLDNHKPANAPERKKTIYAFDCPENCIAFNDNEGNFYYRVKMINPVACPMCLTDELQENNSDKNISIANEYWNPSLSWKFLEYLSPEMEILEIISPPDKYKKIKGRMNYDADHLTKQNI